MVNGDGFSVSSFPERDYLQSPLILSDLNIPLCGLAAFLVLICLDLRIPEGTFWEKLNRVDWSYVSIGLLIRPLINVDDVEEMPSLLPAPHPASSA
jgi:hypothetical protein